MASCSSRACRRCRSRGSWPTCSTSSPTRPAYREAGFLQGHIAARLRRVARPIARGRMKILLNGEPAGVDDLRCLVQVNYGHFTVMRVEQGGVRGLDLHLDRLQRTTRELFGTDLDRARVRDYLRRAVSGETRDLSVRINIFSRALDREHLDKPSSADVLVIAAPASQSPVTPLRLKSFRYTREVAAIKHVGTFALFHFRRMAQQAGFDDALFVDEEGRISEGSIWNIGFVDSKDGVVWPDAPQLDGISMQLLKSAL